MKLPDLVDWAADKTRFETLQDYIEFAEYFLDFKDRGLQAVIVSQNENNYNFFQYKEDGFHNITRPINSDLLYSRSNAEKKHREFLESLGSIRELEGDQASRRRNLIEVIYTAQQCIGAALDGAASGLANRARKVNGDLFERFIQLIILELGVSCTSGVMKLPIEVDGQVAFKMNYQHDLLVTDTDDLKIIGSVKTSSKDRIDKIFMDKFLYCKLTGTDLPHIAIFLNDVQRKKTRKENKYGVSATFLPGRFKGFTVKLNPLDGVYYCDIRPNMLTEPILKNHIKTIDHLLCDDLWQMLEEHHDDPDVEIKA